MFQGILRRGEARRAEQEPHSSDLSPEGVGAAAQRLVWYKSEKEKTVSYFTEFQELLKQDYKIGKQ